MDSFGARFGALVKVRRGVEGLTQQQLAVNAFGEEGHKSRISELENGRTENPHQRTVDALVIALALSANDVAACRKPRVPEVDQNQLKQVGLTHDLIDALSWRFGFSNPKSSPQEYLKFLRQKSHELAELQARLGVLGEEHGSIAEMIGQARQAIQTGDFTNADRILDGAEREEIANRTIASIRQPARICMIRGETALFHDQVDDAREHFLRGVRMFLEFDKSESAALRREACIRLRDHSENFGGIGLVYAEELAQENLEWFKNDPEGEGFAQSLGLLGQCARCFADRTGDMRAALLLKALRYFNESKRISESIGPSQDRDIAVGKLNIGQVSIELASDLSGWMAEGFLKQGVNSLRSAKDYFASDNLPERYAGLLTSLGNGLQRLAKMSEVQEAMPLYMEATTIHQEASEFATKHELAGSFANAQVSLGTLAFEFSDYVPAEQLREYLVAAQTCFECALIYYTQETDLRNWSKLTENLGHVNLKLSNIPGEDRGYRLGSALKSFDKALRAFEELGLYHVKQCKEARDYTMRLISGQ